MGALNDLQAGRLTADDADKTQLQAQDDLVDSIEAVEGVVQEMLAAVRASDGSLLGASARGTAHDLGLLVAAARDMAAATHAATNQQAILLAAKLIARKVCLVCDAPAIPSVDLYGLAISALPSLLSLFSPVPVCSNPPPPPNTHPNRWRA